jgi:succinate-semialdehyde dehydrogenase/glutarate-semialdehyde dehydrogenase
VPIATTDPATGEVLKTFEPMTAEQVDRRVARAATGYETLRHTPSPGAPSG